MEYKVGDKIRIISLVDPSPRYNGKTGIIQNISVDPWGDTQFHGTWGSVAIYPNIDKIELVEKGDK